MTRHVFHKICLFSFLMTMLFVTGCSSLTPQKAQPKTMREELLEFEQGTHPDKEMSDVKATKILEKYIYVGMPIEQALEISKKNGINFTKMFRTKLAIDKGVDVYVGAIDHRGLPLHSPTYKLISFSLETKHDQQDITSVKAHYFAFSRIN